MSALAHITAALAETAFASPHVKTAVGQLIDSIDEDLDRTGYQPSHETEARLQQFIGVIREAVRARAAPEEDEEEQRDTQRLS
jgi:hypothetical protein